MINAETGEHKSEENGSSSDREPQNAWSGVGQGFVDNVHVLVLGQDVEEVDPTEEAGEAHEEGNEEFDLVDFESGGNAGNGDAHVADQAEDVGEDEDDVPETEDVGLQAAFVLLKEFC